MFVEAAQLARETMGLIDPTSYVHPTAVILGEVSLGQRVSIWPTAVLRGDSDVIVIGEDSNVQDGSVIHADEGIPTHIGKRVAIGHRAIVHGATIEDDVLIGMGAILLNGSRVGTGSIIAAGAVLTEGKRIPENSLVIGVPGRIVRQTTNDERERIRRTVDAYLELAEQHRAGRWTARRGLSS
jgi:carbonic anhydrase/acetyltransferase-like protein (isoleucine patch superfamily)